ncbi:MAG: ABC-2 family transporter protein [Elusimicrobia bacterium]|nr:ABC-2 family transporter protein [Elusimicrobiota bacterium]
MSKYLAAYGLNLQEELQRRASLVMDRLGSLTLVLSLYFLWSALLSDPNKNFLGYSRSQMLTYVLGLVLLRALVLTNRVFDLTWEIARGKISSLLMRPVNIFAYQLSLDLSDKTVRVASAIVEISVLVLILGAELYWPKSFSSVVLALVATLCAMTLFYFIGLALASSGFWTAESIGFLWASSLFMEFCSGAFFPLDVLPPAIQGALKLLPFPYLVYFPINIYLERAGGAGIMQGFSILIGWTLAFAFLSYQLWRKGMKDYQAEGG